MLRFAVALSSILAVAGQIEDLCTCFRSDSQGYFQTTSGLTTPPGCNECYTGPDSPIILNPITNPFCKILDFCKDFSRPERERTCYGITPCLNSEVVPCNCTSPFSSNPRTTGKFCQDCIAGFTGWPQCLTPLCDANTCSLQGTCNDNGAARSCGIDRFGNPLSYRPDIQSCSKKTFNAAIGQGDEVSASSVALPLGRSACGPLTCVFGQTCNGAGAASQCCFEYENFCESEDGLTTDCCGPSQSCCDGACCNAGDACAADTTVNPVPCVGCWTVNSRPQLYLNDPPVGTSTYFNQDIESCQQLCKSTSGCEVFTINGATCYLVSQISSYGPALFANGWFTGPKNCPDGTWSCGGGAWNNWEMRDGSTLAPKMKCQAAMSALAVTRIVILPICMIVAFVVGLGLVFSQTGLNPITVAVPAVVLVVLSIFLAFTRMYSTAIMIVLTSYLAMAAGHKGGNAFLVALVAEIFALGSVLGFFLTTATGAPIASLFPSYANSATPTWGEFTTCSQFFGYFYYANPNGGPTFRPWDVNPASNFGGYCSEGWYSYIGICAALVVLMQMVLLVGTGVAWLKGAPSMK